MFATLRSRLSGFFFPDRIPPKPEITERLRVIEASQSQILELLQELTQDEIPRNTNRLFKISHSRTVLYLNDLLPQVYLTLVSVLQGVVLALLIDEFRFDYWESNVAIYGYMLSSLLIIAAFWFSYLSAMFDGRWPFHFLDTLLFFVLAATQAIAVRNVSDPSRWCASMMVMCLVIAFIYLRQVSLLRQMVASDLFEDPDEARIRIRGVRVIALLSIVAAGIAGAFIPVTASDPQNLVAASLAVAIPMVYIILAIRSTSRVGLDVIG